MLILRAGRYQVAGNRCKRLLLSIVIIFVIIIPRSVVIMALLMVLPLQMVLLTWVRLKQFYLLKNAHIESSARYQMAGNRRNRLLLSNYCNNICNNSTQECCNIVQVVLLTSVRFRQFYLLKNAHIESSVPYQVAGRRKRLLLSNYCNNNTQ